MSVNRRSSRVTTVPFDLVVVLAYLVVVGALVVVGTLAPGSPLRVALTLPLVLFLPGYALVAAAFPHAPPAGERGSLLDLVRQPPTGLDHVERLALGFGLSLALLPFVGMLIAASPGAFTARTALVVLTAATALFAVIGALRRWRLDPAERYTLPTDTWASAVGSATDGTTLDVALSVALAFAVLLAASAGVFALAAPLDAMEFTGFGIGSINEEGEFVVSGYPEEVAPGATLTQTFVVKNHEENRVEYTVVVQMQRINENGRIVEIVELGRYSESVGAGLTWKKQHQVTARLSGERLQVVYLLYKGDVPPTPTRSNAYRVTYFWTSVGSDGTESALRPPR